MKQFLCGTRSSSTTVNNIKVTVDLEAASSSRGVEADIASMAGNRPVVEQTRHAKDITSMA